MSYVLADPQSTLNFAFDWSDWLQDGDTITSHAWSISPMNEGTPATPALVGDTTDTVFVSGMEAGKIYRLTDHVVTAAGLEDERTIMLRCDDT